MIKSEQSNTPGQNGACLYLNINSRFVINATEKSQRKSTHTKIMLYSFCTLQQKSQLNNQQNDR